MWRDQNERMYGCIVIFYIVVTRPDVKSNIIFQIWYNFPIKILRNINFLVTSLRVCATHWSVPFSSFAYWTVNIEQIYYRNINYTYLAIHVYKNMETEAFHLLEHDGIWYLDNGIAGMRLYIAMYECSWCY